MHVERVLAAREYLLKPLGFVVFTALQDGSLGAGFCSGCSERTVGATLRRKSNNSV